MNLKLLIKKDTRIIDIGGGFIAEVHIEQMVTYNHKIYITHEDFPDAKYLISSVDPQFGVRLLGETDILKFLRQSDNYKEIWYDRLKAISDNIRRFQQ